MYLSKLGEIALKRRDELIKYNTAFVIFKVELIIANFNQIFELTTFIII